MRPNQAERPAGSRSLVLWLLRRSVPRAPWRLVLEAVAVAFPVAMLATTLLFVDAAVQAMTPNALRLIQVEMRAVAKSLDTDIRAISAKLATESSVTLAEPFAAASVIVAPGTSGQVTARLFAVDPAYFKHHPWLRIVSGSLDQGVLLSQSVQASPGFESAKSVTISLPGDAPDLSLSLPVGGMVDLRQASTWFSVPYGEVQGDIVAIPRAIVIDYEAFERDVLPVLRSWADEGGLPQFDPGSDELPSASLEAHVTIDHAAYPADPGQAAIWSNRLQRILGRLAGVGAPVIVADNAGEVLIESRDDSTNAKILFLLLGIPGVAVAAALGLTAASALVEAYRREDALLRMRGASNGQIAWLATSHAALAGVAGSALGLLIAAAAVSAATGRPVWQGIPAFGFGLSIVLAVMAGAITLAVRVLRLWKASRRSVTFERRLFDRGYEPTWRRARLDLVAILVGIAILGINLLAGGLRRSPVEGLAVALSFYVLLAPIGLWLGVTLLAIRGLLVLLAMWGRPERARPTPSWWGTSIRWLGRRPAHTARALAIGALAVAFGTEVLTFTTTYQTAKEADARASIGSDLNLAPGDPRLTLPPLGPQVAAVSPIRLVPTRVDTDRKTVLAIDMASYRGAVTAAPRMLAGEGIEGLVKDPHGALINAEIAKEFELGPGDMVPLTVFPDDYENASDLELRVLGVYSSFPPMSPNAEVVTTTAAIPRVSTVPPDFYLARIAPGQSAGAVAVSLRNGLLAQKFAVTTITPPNERGLTALNLVGLGAIESIGAGLVAAIGVAVLGAFIILERRREFAILYTVGADIRQILTGPVLEGASVVLGSAVIGVPVGLGLGILAVQVLGLFFSLAPPVLTVPVTGLAILLLAMTVGSTIALGVALAAVNRLRVTSVLRDL